MSGFVLIDTRRAAMFSILVLPWLVGCQQQEAVHIINGCLAPGVEQVRATGRSMEVKCTFSITTFLIALPPPKPSAEALAELGLTDDAADSIRASTMTGNRWCTMTELKPESEFAKPGGSIVCVNTDVSIGKALSVKAQSVAFELGPSGMAEVSLRGLRSADK